MADFDDINLLRIQRGTGKVCRCYDKATFSIDRECRKIYCNVCGAEVDAFDAMWRVASNGQRYLDRYNTLKAEVAELEKKRCRSTLFREMESSYLYGKNRMMPRCPRCDEPFEFERIGAWTGREYYLKQKQKGK